MTVLICLALLVLTAALVLLYAMMGELSTRIPEAAEPAAHVTRLTDFRPGASAASWPAALEHLADRPRAALLVLSPVCTTCDRVAAELSGADTHRLGMPLGLVISSGSSAAGEEFVSRHSLRRLPHSVDEGGDWVRGNFGVNMSPSALLLEKGVLTDAYSFGSFDALRNDITATDEEKQHEHASTSHS